MSLIKNYKRISTYPAILGLAKSHLTLLSLLFVFFISLTAKVQAQSTAGSLDTSFGFSGWAYTAQFGQCTSMVIQPDGKILTAGFIEYQNNISTITVARMLTNGNLDTSFGTNGVTQTFFGPDSTNAGRNAANAIALQADGSIIVAGFYTPTGSSSGDFAIVRFTSTGLRDSSFGVGGRVLTDFGGNESARAVAIQSDGKIVVAGGTALARYNTNGVLDSSYGTNGKVTTRINTNAISIGQNSGITLAGGTQYEYAIEARADNGSIISTFGNQGVVITQFGSGIGQANAIVRQPNGATLVAGWGFNNNDQFFQVSRYQSDQLDTSFSDDGKLIINLTSSLNTLEEARSIAIQPDGKIVLAGFARRLTQFDVPRNDFILIRLNRNGTFDTSFGSGGVVRANPCGNTSCDDSAFGTALQADGKIVFAGTGLTITQFNGAYNNFTVGRLSPGPTSSGKFSDFDGDGRADISVFRSSDRNWYLNRSSQGFAVVQWGLSTDKLAPADYDGDGKTDVAVWREGSLADFYVLNSADNTVRVEQFGQTGDALTVGDWDGDGKADPAVYRDSAVGSQSYFYYRGSNNNPNRNVTYLPWGTTGDKPQLGDFDNDGKTDLAVFRPSNATWHIRQSSDSQVRYENWGLATDKFVPADYDGDGKTDLAVFRNGTWYIRNSSNNQTQYINFGIGADIPVPADYDGDGKADVAVFRNGTWYLLQSTSGVSIQQFGLANDKPVPAAFIP